MLSRRLLALGAALAAVPLCGAAGERTGSAGGSALYLVPMDELTVPIVDGPRMSGRLRVKLVLQATDATTAQRLRTDAPGLREAAVAAATEFGRLYASPSAAVDARRLVDDLDRSLRTRRREIAHTLLVEVAAVRV